MVEPPPWMWPAAVAHAVLVGTSCFGPSYDEPRCSPRGECPTGFACRDGVCLQAGDIRLLPDADVIDAAEIDADDGVADAVVDSAPDATECPMGYIDLGIAGSRYRVAAVGETWLAAERDCEDDSAGAATHLIVLDSAEELAAIDSRVIAAWVGISDRRTENDFLAVTGGHPLFQPWAPNEPNDSFGEDCVELDGSTLNDEECADRQLFVCECDGRPPDPTTY